MKKILVWMLVLTLCLSLCACGDKTGGDTAENTTGPAGTVENSGTTGTTQNTEATQATEATEGTEATAPKEPGFISKALSFFKRDKKGGTEESSTEE